MGILTEVQKDLVRCLQHHNVQQEIATMIILLLRETKRGQIMLIEYLVNMDSQLTEREIMKKAIELKEMKD